MLYDIGDPAMIILVPPTISPNIPPVGVGVAIATVPTNREF